MVSEGSVEMSTCEGEGAPDHGEWLEKAEAHQAATANAGAGAIAKSMMPPPVALQQSESGLTVAFGALGTSTTPPPRAAGGASCKPILLPTIHQRARLMFLMVLLTPFAIAAAAAQDEPATLAAIVQQMSSLQQRVALLETENADLRLELAEVKGVRQGPPNAHFAVSSLGQSRQLGESPETCCRWTPGETCQTTEEVCTMVHEYIEGKALTVECGVKWKKCPETSAAHAEPVQPSAGFALLAYSPPIIGRRLLHTAQVSRCRERAVPGQRQGCVARKLRWLHRKCDAVQCSRRGDHDTNAPQGDARCQLRRRAADAHSSAAHRCSVHAPGGRL